MSQSFTHTQVFEFTVSEASPDKASEDPTSDCDPESCNDEPGKSDDDCLGPASDPYGGLVKE